MKKLISIIILLAIVMCSVIVSIPVEAEETDTEPETQMNGTEAPIDTEESQETLHDWADYYRRYIIGPFTSDEELNESISLGDTVSEGLFDELPDKYIPLIANDINEKREHAIRTGDADSDKIITGEEFAERLRDSLEIGCFIRISAGEDGYVIIRRSNEQFEVIKGKPINVIWDGDGTSIETVPVETEPVVTEPVETEPVETDAPGTGGTEPVVAPKTVDRLALIAGVFVISLAICAAAFTVVKAKKR